MKGPSPRSHISNENQGSIATLVSTNKSRVAIASDTMPLRLANIVVLSFICLNLKRLKACHSIVTYCGALTAHMWNAFPEPVSSL